MRGITTDTAAMPKDLKLINREKILSTIAQSETIMLNEVADATGISRQTIVKAIESFVEQGIVLSLGKGQSTSLGGKRPEIYSFNKNYRYNICVRLENHVLKVVLTNLINEIICVIDKPHGQNEPLENIIWDFRNIYAQIMLENKLTDDKIFMVGVCLGGITDEDTGIMRYNSLYPNWGRDIPIVSMFKTILPENINVYICNEAKMTGYAELYYNKSLLDKSYVAIYTLDGIAAGYIDRGKIMMGSHTLIGEIGHMTLDANDVEICQCGSCGCFERIVSLDRLYNRIVNSRNYEQSVLFRYGTGLTMENIFNAADNDADELAMDTVRYVAKFFSMALKNIIINIDPELIIIQGIYSSAGTYFHKQVLKNLGSFKYMPRENPVEITYDSREVWHLAVTGISMCLVDRFMANESMYK
ncbi:MAG: ROK family transcriptional regulator [Firmicutes bacterium]|nr:ROK family transcriptional regulator [Bacillota bacterium]